MAKTFFIALGPKSNGFYDQITGITVARGEKVEITERQKETRKISMALNAGQLILVQPDTKVETFSEADAKKLDKKIREKVGKGVTLDKICQNISMEQAKSLADLHELEVNDKDTVQTIIEAVIADYDAE